MEYPEPASRHAHHERCDADRDDMQHYRVPADRLRFRADFLDWTAHLMEKAWL
ncbi:hypothetical protein OHT52_30890 [Streptomyces sp. NBC_00247]|uniref:hypothetical protein n=1 Tax=Streptomyces sp. NBC_00247 TaxID=2975689 RepID=UPI002E2CF84F|nr:hypothetical protein [Streptomyces sp. NBC_00247]